MIRIAHVTNPFEPEKNKLEFEHEGDISLWDWLQHQYPGFEEFPRPTICQVNGEYVLRPQWKETQLKDGDFVVFTTVLQDPGTLAIIAVVIAVGAAVYAYTNMPKPKDGNLPEADPTYSLRGHRNQNRLMQAIESPFGRNFLYPSIASRSYTVYSGNEQFLFSLLCLGHGEYDVHGVFIEDTPIENFQDIIYEVYGPSELVTLFPDNVTTAVEVSNIELFGPNEPEYDDWSGPYIVNGAGTQVNRIEVDYAYPQGLYLANDDGGLDNITVTAEYQYQEIDDSGNAIGSWTTLLITSHTMKTTTPQRFTGGLNVTAGRYQVRGRRTNDKNTSHKAGNKLVWEVLRAFQPSTQDYGEVTMLAVKARASNNLNDQAATTIKVDATRKLPTYNPTTETWSAPQATRSAVWALCEVFRANYGARLADTYLDLPSLYQLDLELTSRGDSFDWVFDTKTTVWEAAKQICRVARAVPRLSGSQIMAVRDIAQTLPKGVFTMDNISEGSFKWDLQFFEINEKDSVNIEYFDRTTGQIETVLCVLPGGTSDNPEDVRLPGCADRDQAYREGMYLAASKEYLREAVNFRTGLEGHIPAYGDIISVSHDIPRWGDSGYVTQITLQDDGSSILDLSEEVVFEQGITYYITLRKSKGEAAGPYQCTEVSNNQVRVQSLDSTVMVSARKEPPYFQFGPSDEWAEICRVVGINPSGKDEIEIKAIIYDGRIHTFDNLPTPPLDTESGPLVTPDLPLVTSLRVNSIPNVIDFVQVAWEPALGASSYIIQESRDGVNWNTVDRITSTVYTLPVIKGYLYLRVSGVNVAAGPWDTWEGEVGTFDTIPNNVIGLSLQQAFTGTFAKIQWQSVVNATSYIVKVYDGATLKRTTEVSGLTFTYSIEMAQQDNNVNRTFTFNVVGKNDLGESETPATLQVTNPIPTKITALFATLSSEDTTTATYDLSWTPTSDVDIDHFVAWADGTSGFTPGPSNEFYSGTASNTSITINKVSDGQGGYDIPNYYWRVSAVDVWGDDTNPSDEDDMTT